MTQAAEKAPSSRHIAAGDGLRLHYLVYDAESATRPPLVCVPGLARSAVDFDAVASRVAARGRRVLALDYRGRGESDWDTDWSHYCLDVEQDDILRILAAEGVASAALLGTSRGGIHTMRLALARPGLVLGAVLNDIGPSVEVAGLTRIKRYVGRLPPLASMSDATALLRISAGAHFTGVAPDQWETYARQTFRETDGKVVLRYDPELSHALDTVGPDMEPPDYWDGFTALASHPLLALRGANSDILSQAVFDEMARRDPDLERLTVPGQGHAPLLLDEPTIAVIDDFLERRLKASDVPRLFPS